MTSQNRISGRPRSVKDGLLIFRSELYSNNNHSWHPRNQFQALKTWFWMVRCHRHPSFGRFSKKTPVPCQGTRNHTISDPPENAIHTPKHDFKPTRVSFGWFLAFQKVLQTSSRHSCSLLETAAATTDDPPKTQYQAPKIIFWMVHRHPNLHFEGFCR